MLFLLMNFLLIFLYKENESGAIYLIDSLSFLPMTLFALTSICLLFEIHLFFPRVRLFYLLFSWVGILAFLKDGIIRMNMVTFILNCCYFPFLLYSLSKVKENSKKEVEEKTLTDGFYSRFQERSMKITVLFIFALGVIMVLLWTNEWKKPLWLGIILFAFVSFVIFIIAVKIIVMDNPLKKAMTKVEKNACYSEFSKQMEKILKEPLNPNTRNYVKAIYANYTFLYDRDLGIKIIEDSVQPQNKTYVSVYDGVRIITLINLERFDDARSLLMTYKENYPLQPLGNMLDRLIVVLGTFEEIPNVEAFYPLGTTRLFVDLSNSSTLMHYYFHRGKMDEAKKYATFILENANDFMQVKKEAQEVIDEVGKGEKMDSSIA